MNTLQLPLDGFEELAADKTDTTISERFEQFDAANPEVFEMLKRICLEMKGRGMPRWSIKAAYEMARWLPVLRVMGDTFRLSNDFHALYSRKLMNEVPELDGFFELRPRREEHHG